MVSVVFKKYGECGIYGKCGFKKMWGIWYLWFL